MSLVRGYCTEDGFALLRHVAACYQRDHEEVRARYDFTAARMALTQGAIPLVAAVLPSL